MSLSQPSADGSGDHTASTGDAYAAAWRRWPAIAGAAALAALAAAYISEHGFGLAPCFLCYVQRWVLWVAVAVAAAAVLIAPRLSPDIREPATRITSALLAAIFFASLGVAGFHAGVEWGWWQGLSVCDAPGAAMTAEDVFNGLGEAVTVASCDQAPLRVAGLSMAGWNVVFSLGLAILSVIRAVRPLGRPTP